MEKWGGGGGGGGTDALIKVLSVENPEPTNVLPLKPGAGQNIATHAFPTASDLFLVVNKECDKRFPFEA